MKVNAINYSSTYNHTRTHTHTHIDIYPLGRQLYHHYKLEN